MPPSSVVATVRSSRSRADWRTQPRSVSAVQPIFDAIEQTNNCRESLVSIRQRSDAPCVGARISLGIDAATTTKLSAHDSPRRLIASFPAEATDGRARAQSKRPRHAVAQPAHDAGRPAGGVRLARGYATATFDMIRGNRRPPEPALLWPLRWRHSCSLHRQPLAFGPARATRLVAVGPLRSDP